MSTTSSSLRFAGRAAVIIASCAVVISSFGCSRTGEQSAAPPELPRPMPDFFVKLSQNNTETAAALNALWQVHETHGDLKAAFPNDPAQFLLWAINDAEHGSHYAPDKLAAHATALEALDDAALQQTMPAFFQQQSQTDPKAAAALQALWQVYNEHADLKQAFPNDAAGLIVWASDDAKHGSTYAPDQLKAHAATLEALESAAIDQSMPASFAEKAKDNPKTSAALHALWRLCMVHGDLHKNFANSPDGLLKWAIDDAKHGSHYGSGEMKPYADTLKSLDTAS